MNGPKIYPYSRISSSKQAKGQGLTIQQEDSLLQELSERYQLPIYEHRMIDSGKSAFHGDHIKDGQLGWFLNAVRSGEVAAGSILVVSSLDRFSRQEIRKATSDLAGVLSCNIGIYSAIEQRMFCDPYGDKSSNVLDIQLAVMILERAHGESRTKQARTLKLRDLAIGRHRNGERHPSGYAYSIKVVGNDVWWVDNSDGVVRPHPVYIHVARQIALRLMAGHSPRKVTDWLNREGPDCPIERFDKRAPKVWSHHVIRRFHLSRALVGEKQINDIILEGYYPPVLTENEYAALVDARTRRKRPRTTGKATAISLFAELPQATCRHCGASIHMNRETGGALNYRCSGFREEYRCLGWSKRAAVIEKALLDICLDKVWKDPETLPLSRVPALQAQIDKINGHIHNLMEQAREKGFPKILTLEIGRLESQLNELSTQMELAKAEEVALQARTCASLVPRWGAISDRVLDTKNDDARIELRELLRDSIASLTIGRPGLISLQDRLALLSDPSKSIDEKNRLLAEEVPRGPERFIFVMDVTFNDGAHRCVTMDRHGVTAIVGTDRSSLGTDVAAKLGSVPTRIFNAYAPDEIDEELMAELETLRRSDRNAIPE